MLDRREYNWKGWSKEDRTVIWYQDFEGLLLVCVRVAVCVVHMHMCVCVFECVRE